MHKDDAQKEHGWCKHSRNADGLAKRGVNQANRRKVKFDLKEGVYRNDTIENFDVFDVFEEAEGGYMIKEEYDQLVNNELDQQFREEKADYMSPQDLEAQEISILFEEAKENMLVGENTTILEEIITDEEPSITHGYIRSIRLTDTVDKQTITVRADETFQYDLKKAKQAAYDRWYFDDYDEIDNKESDSHKNEMNYYSCILGAGSIKKDK